MPIQLVRHDITQMQVDAIVNTTNKGLQESGGVNGAILRAGGPLLSLACLRLGGCKVGEVKLTRGYNLPCRYVIHTVSPVWRGQEEDKALLAACYRRALRLAVQHGCRSIAFPLIASGAHGFPKALALRIATEAINTFLLQHVPDNDLMVYLVMFSKESMQAGSKLFADIRQYIDDCYVQAHTTPRQEAERYNTYAQPAPDFDREYATCAMPAPKTQRPATLEEALRSMDEGFSQALQRLIQEKGMKNADCYKRANIDKKLFSKIINNADYKPKKTTALALAVALELSLAETQSLLQKAGLALSHSSKFDVIVEYFLLKERYDIFEINEALYEFDQPLLGGTLA